LLYLFGYLRRYSSENSVNTRKLTRCRNQQDHTPKFYSLKKFRLCIKLDFLPVKLVVLFGFTDVKLKCNEAVLLTYVRSLTVHSFLLCLSSV